MTPDDVLRQANLCRHHRELALFGYAAGENRQSYPAVLPEKATELYGILSRLADVLIVDTIFGISSLLVSAGLVSMYSCLYASVMTDCKTVRYLRMVGGAKRCPFPSVRPIGEEKKSIIR